MRDRATAPRQVSLSLQVHSRTLRQKQRHGATRSSRRCSGRPVQSRGVAGRRARDDVAIHLCWRRDRTSKPGFVVNISAGEYRKG